MTKEFIIKIHMCLIDVENWRPILRNTPVAFAKSELVFFSFKIDFPPKKEIRDKEKKGQIQGLYDSHGKYIVAHIKMIMKMIIIISDIKTLRKF